MASSNVIGKFTDEVEQAAGEVAKDVKDEVGEALEQGAQSVVGPQSFDAVYPERSRGTQDRQKQEEDRKKEIDRQKQLVYTRKWLKDLQMAQEKVRQENKQKEQQRLQEEQQKEKLEEIKKEEKKKQPVNPAIAYAGKVEYKRGVGG